MRHCSDRFTFGHHFEWAVAEQSRRVVYSALATLTFLLPPCEGSPRSALEALSAVDEAQRFLWPSSPESA